MEPTRVIGMALKSAVETFGLPQSMFTFRGSEEARDDVVFYYADHMYLFWYKDRVWQVRYDRRSTAVVHGVSLGMSRAGSRGRRSRAPPGRKRRLAVLRRRGKLPGPRAAGVRREHAVGHLRVQERLLNSPARICLVLASETLEEDFRSLESMRGRVDLVELRADHLRDGELEAAGRLPGRAGLPVILTVRRVSDGGKYAGAERDRCALLRRLVGQGFAYVDIEEDLQAPDLEDVIRQSGTRIITVAP